MKQTKTKAFVLALLGIVGLSACGNPTADENVEVEWWVPCGSDTTSNNIYAYCSEMAAAFTEANPDIKVKVTSKGSYSNDYNGAAGAVSDALTGGNTPTMVTTYGTYVAAWRKAAPEAVADVTSHGVALEADADFNQDYLKVEKQQYNNTAYYSLPYSKSGETLQYNVEAFAAVGDAVPGAAVENGYPAPQARAEKKAYNVPTTFAEMMALSSQIKTDYPSIDWGRGEDGYYKAVPVIYESAMNLFVTVLESAGIPFLDISKSPAQSAVFLDDQRVKDICVQLKKWSNEGLLATADQLPMRNEYSHEYPSTFVGNGKSFVMITSTANAPWDAADGYSIGFTKVPKWEDSSAYRTLSQGPSIAFFNHANPKELEGALKFYDFLTKKENTARLALETYYFPTRKSSSEVEAIKKAVEDAGKTVTFETAYADKQSAYLGEILLLNDDVTAKREYFMSPVNELSGKVRSAVTGILRNLFNDVATTSDADIRAMVDAQFASAKNTILA